MSIRICDRCGDVTLRGEGCTCTTPYSLSEFRRRHQAAVASARSTTERERARTQIESSGHPAAAVADTTASPTGLSSPGDERAAPRRTAAATVSGHRAQARIPGRDSMSRSGSGAPDAHADAAPPGPRAPRAAPDPNWLHGSDQAPITTD
jgi:hypothetical protein